MLLFLVICIRLFTISYECILKSKFFCADLLAKGRSTGQTVRYLFNPDKRRRDEQAEQDALNPPEDKPASPGGEQEEGDGKEEEGCKPEEPKEPARQCFNMVCYGLPNLIVTQIGKV